MSLKELLACRPVVIFLLSGFLSTTATFAQTLAFPGALGFGANATGGRNGTVYHVTTLADSGPGSFRDAVSHSGRIIVFDVGGYITLNSAVSCSGDLTIAGQTAPGGGIGFKGGEISFANRANIICRYIRIRPGSDTASTEDDALSLYLAQNVICDHVSMEFAPWNNVDAVSDDWQAHPVTSVTFQNCLNADPTGQQFGAHTESVSSTMSWFYTIFANSHNRNPLSKINDVFVNNVLYNCSAGYTTHTSTEFNHDIVNNYFISGPAYGGSSDFPWFQVDNNQSIYYSGNLFDGNEDNALNGSITTPYWYQGDSGTILSAPWSPITTNLPNYSAASAYRITVSQAGALPRDQIDNLVISQVKTLGNGITGTGAGTTGPDGSLYTSQTQTGLGNNGYGVINGGIAPLDSDGDGMPDYWELTTGLNYLANDAMTISSDGYANIEHYINWLADPHAQTVTNTDVDVDLWQYTSGFTNASPVYSVNNASNGVVSLTSGHIAHFSPTTNFFGLGSFQFSVLASDGSTYTNTVTIAIVPQSVTQLQPSNLIWIGDGVSNLWTVGDGTNWFDGTNLVTFSAGDTVTFDDTGSNTPAINLSGFLSAGTVYVLAEQDYTFSGSGSLSGIASLFKTGSGQLNINTANSYSGGTMINEGVVQLGDGVNFNGSIAGNITNNDTLIFNNPGAVSVSASISGSGVLIKNGAGALALNGTQTYTNLTAINAGSLQFSGPLPSGDIVDNGALILAPSGSTTINNFISGIGNVTISSSGTTTLSGNNTYSGGTTNSGGTLNIANNAAIGTGPVSYLSGGIRLADGDVITNTFVVPGSTSDSMLDCVSGSATWAGDIVLVAGGAQFRPSGISGTLTLTGTGILGNRNFIINRGSVRFASNAVFSATGTASSFDRNSTGNSAFITVADNASVSFGQFSLGGAQASGGRMTLTISDNANFSATSFDIHNSTASAAVSGVFLNGGTLSVGSYIKTRTGGSQLSTNFFNGGVLKALNDNASFLPALSGFKAIIQSGGAKIDDGGFAITIAAPLLHDPLGAAFDGGLTKLGAGTLLLNDANTYNGPTIIAQGTLALGGATVANPFAATTNIYIASGALLDATAESPFSLPSGRTLWGDGSISGTFIIGSAAILSSGSNSIGKLTFYNSLTLASGSTNLFEISHSPLTNDSVVVSGSLQNGGTLIVTNIGNTALAAGDAFKLFDAASYSGTFANVVLPALNPGLAWNTNTLNTNGVISVISTAPPVPPTLGNVSLSGNDFIFSGNGGKPNAQFYLIGSTNVAMPLSNWTRLLTNQFDNGGNFNFTNPLDPNSPQTFYMLQLP